jgi:hypothetical protein
VLGYVNRASVELRPGTTLAQTEELATSVGGRLLDMSVGVDDTDEYANFEFDVSTRAGLLAAIRRLEASPLVKRADPWVGRHRCGGGDAGPDSVRPAMVLVTDGGTALIVSRTRLEADCLSGGRDYRFGGVGCESIVPARPRVGPDGGPGHYLNQVVVHTRPGTTFGQLEAAATSVGGRVVRRDYSQGLQGEAWLEVPATTEAELDALMARLKRDPCVAFAAPQATPRLHP